MNKKVFIVTIAVLLCAASLAGCGQSDADVNTGNSVIADSGDEISGSASAEVADKEWWEYANVGWEQHYLDLSTGVKLSYLTLGNEDGIPVILIHGASDSRLSWAQVAPILADKGYRVYIPELRGHGKSSVIVPQNEVYTVEDYTDDIREFIEAEGIQNPNIVGHSLGTLIAQRLAAENPDNIASITLIATGAKSTGNETIDWVLNGDGEEFLGVKGYSDTKTLPDDFLKIWTETTNEDDDFRKGIYEHAKQLPYDVWLYLFNGLAQFDNTDGLADIKAPVQIIWGTGDTLFTEDDQKELIDGLVNADDVRYETIDNASHNVHWDSKEIASHVSDLIADYAR